MRCSQWRAFARVTVMLAALGLSAHAQAQSESAYTGVYTGNFIGAFDNGPFSVLVQPSGVAIVLAFDLANKISTLDTSVTVASDGSFSKSGLGGDPGTSVNGQFVSLNALTGTFIADGASGSFSGARKADGGAAAAVAGHYTGTYSAANCADGTSVSGALNGIVAADGSFLMVTDVVQPAGAADSMFQGALSIAPSNQASFGGQATNGAVFLGALDLTAATAAGSWKTDLPQGCDGTFELGRVTAAVPRRRVSALITVVNSLLLDD